jgi:hypothetical protein
VADGRLTVRTAAECVVETVAVDVTCADEEAAELHRTLRLLARAVAREGADGLLSNPAMADTLAGLARLGGRCRSSSSVRRAPAARGSGGTVVSISHRKVAEFLGVDPDADRRPRDDGEGRVVVHPSEAAVRLGLTEADVVRMVREGRLIGSKSVDDGRELWIVESSREAFRRAF